MGFLNIQVTTKKNGQQMAWFRDTLGRRVGTRPDLVTDRARVRRAEVGRFAPATITSAEQMAWLANYLIELQEEQLDAGIGSNGQAMPKLSGRSYAVFDRGGSRPRFVERLYRGYQGEKAKRGQPPIRNLYLTGQMRRDIRINYLDDQTAKVSITTAKSRQKALANERKSPWWGLSPANSRKFAAAQATIFGGAMEDYLDRLGLVQAGSYMVKLAQLLNRKKSSLARRVA
jgi:hypothetical protein